MKKTGSHKKRKNRTRHLENVAPETAAEPDETDDHFPIIGIGASAGGLEAIEQFFTHMPGNSRMASVVIQHQDPDQTSLLPEILQRYTDMPVVQIGEGGVKARPNTVYARPSNSDLGITHGSFVLLKPVTGAGAIDIFFRHLAEDQDGKAVGDKTWETAHGPSLADRAHGGTGCGTPV